MTEPPESLTDPAHERLTKHDEALKRHYRWRTQRPPVEFTRSTWALVYTAVVLALTLALVVIGYVIVHVWRIP